MALCVSNYRCVSLCLLLSRTSTRHHHVCSLIRGTLQRSYLSLFVSLFVSFSLSLSLSLSLVVSLCGLHVPFYSFCLNSFPYSHILHRRLSHICFFTLRHLFCSIRFGSKTKLRSAFSYWGKRQSTAGNSVGIQDFLLITTTTDSAIYNDSSLMMLRLHTMSRHALLYIIQIVILELSYSDNPNLTARNNPSRMCSIISSVGFLGGEICPFPFKAPLDRNCQLLWRQCLI